jgi:hypothetical protein
MYSTLASIVQFTMYYSVVYHLIHGWIWGVFNRFLWLVGQAVAERSVSNCKLPLSIAPELLRSSRLGSVLQPL